MRVSPLGGDRAGAVVIHHDITQLRMADLRARMDESRLLRALDETSPIFVLIDPTGVISYITERTCSLLGLDRDEVLGSDGFSFVEPLDVERGQEALAAVLAEAGGRARIECRVLDGTGRRRVVDLTAVNMLDEPGVRAVAVTGTDVTGTRLNQIADRLERQLLQQLPAAVVAVDDHGGIVYWNQRAEQMLRVPHREAMGRRLGEIGIRAPHVEATREILRRVRRERRWEGPLDEDALDLVRGAPPTERPCRASADGGGAVDDRAG